MTIVQLEYIIAVDVFRHFVTAAEECNVTQPTLSMQIKKLEEELEVVIFDRNKQPIEPTKIGKRLIEQAKEIIQGKERITELIDNTRNEVAGEVKIGIIPTIASYLVPLFIPSLVDKYPDLKIHVEELMTHQVIQQMKDGNIDIGIVSTPVVEEGIEELPVYYESFALYLANDHKLFEQDKVSSRDVKLDEMWLLTDGHCFRNHVINLCGEKNYMPKKLKFSYKTGSLEVLMRFVDSNHGYTLLPYLATLNLNDEQKRKLRFFKEPSPKREISIVTPKGYLRDKLIEAIKKEIRINIPIELRHLDNGKVIQWKKV